MLAPERQRHILHELEQREAVRVSELSAALGVSEMTVRRDIETLHAAGSLRKIHGGARRLGTFGAFEPGFAAKSGQQQAAKAAIAGAALALVRPGMTISVSAGTTTHQLAGLLGNVGNLTVVTNSLKAADAIYRLQAEGGATGSSVIITGGERTPSEALVGPVATASIRRLHTDLCFMGVHGLHLECGLTTPNLAEAETNTVLAAGADQLVVLADHTKFGISSLAKIAPLAQVDTLVTDDGLATAAQGIYAEQVGELIVADIPAATLSDRQPAVDTAPLAGRSPADQPT
ncbi:DeoR/GlpR family DNA-binding transcription regulator [Arthrobacter sp. GCM10027362]|uniref:DeoR/GlpR family DNA-binding transcription regulator n=1 Tax=Arthrobacter sp. GCM10027362 TaxID=3273379 RepID=UPI00363A2463